VNGRILAVTGLKREAALIIGPGLTVIASGGRPLSLAEALQRILSEGPLPDAGPPFVGVVSIGIAGALEPDLALGDAVVAQEVAGPDRIRSTDPAWRERLLALLPEARKGRFAGSDQMVAAVADKAALRTSSGALCVDMESHVAAAAAEAFDLPFAAVRFISDAADRALPPLAQVGMGADGGMNLWGVLKGLAREPQALPALIRTGLEAEIGFRALLRGRRRLGPTLGLANV
jgi:hopanoid-associated phosphorylase